MDNLMDLVIRLVIFAVILYIVYYLLTIIFGLLGIPDTFAIIIVLLMALIGIWKYTKTHSIL